MKSKADSLSIGVLSKRTGLSISSIRFYETKGLIHPSRNGGGQRRFKRSDIRRLSFILITQQLGLTIAEIQAVFTALPEKRTPTEKDWAKISKAIKKVLQEKITSLQKMSDTLDGCIGCGCLSLKNCELYNPNDKISKKGPGPRILLGDPPPV